MKLLSIETSSLNCSVAIFANSKVYEKTQIAVKQQGALILPTIRELLSTASISLNQIDAFVFSSGPGSFTGLRIASGIVQGLAFAMNRPVIAVPTMSALAYAAAHKYGVDTIEILINARMREFFYGCYQVSIDGVKELFPDSLIKYQDFLQSKLKNSDLLIYNDCSEYSAELVEKYRKSSIKLVENFYPTAAMLLPIAEFKFKKGDFLAIEDAVPTYLRGKDAWHKN